MLRRSALSLINAGYRFARTFGPQVVAYGLLSPSSSDGSLSCCRYSIAILQVHGLPGFMPQMHLEDFVGATASHVVGLIPWISRLQAGVLNDGGCSTFGSVVKRATDVQSPLAWS